MGWRQRRKVKQIIAHVTQCPLLHQGPLRGGASPEELMEAIWVAAEMRAGGSYAHSALALAKIEKFSAAEAE